MTAKDRLLNLYGFLAGEVTCWALFKELLMGLTASFKPERSVLPSLLYLPWKNPSLCCIASGGAVTKIHPGLL